MTTKFVHLLSFLLLLSCAHSAVQQTKTIEGYDAELTNFTYPRQVYYFEFVSQKQGLRMAYVLAEPKMAASGETVLLLHGKNFSAAYWEPTIQALVEKGFRVIAPDQVGFGKSSKPERYQFSFQTLARNTKALLDSLGVKRVHVVGHSMGGMLATRFALMFPEATSRLALVNPIGLEDWKTMVSYKTVDEAFAQELKATPESIREYQRQSYFGGEWKPEYNSLVQVLAGWTKHPDYPRVAWNSALTADMIFTQPVVYEFARLQAPTLLIIGQKDRTAIGKAWASEDVKQTMGNYPALGRKVAALIPNAKLVEIEAAGHLPQIQNFDEYSKALLSFLLP